MEIFETNKEMGAVQRRFDTCEIIETLFHV